MRSVTSIIEDGSSGTLIKVECHLSNSLPMIVIVGFTHRSIAESKERIRGALASSGIKLPAKRIIVNLAPADIPKHGSSFDLPILVAILLAANITLADPGPNTVIMGEVGLDGTISPIRGIIGKILVAQACGIKTFWIPHDNLAQASLIPSITVHGFKSVAQLYSVLTRETAAPLHEHIKPQPTHEEVPFDDVVGQERAKRALMIAAAGHHNVLLSGSPGTGKSMLARQLLPLLPAMSRKEMLDTTHLHSLTGKKFDQIITKRPFRSPHHSASPVSILGGGAQMRPGEISLGHHGVLFLDELPEFSRTVIEGLREPLEDNRISISRNNGTIEFPAHILLVATANPCPCGHFGSDKPCSCNIGQLIRYRRKLSGPILDRIDLYCETEPVNHERLLVQTPQTSLSRTIESIKNARQIQLARNGKLNSQLTNRELQEYGQLMPKARSLLDTAAQSLGLSARSYIRTLRVSRTIADLESSQHISEIHMAEALQYRQKELDLPSS